ncbi:CdaR family transcriptional regulator [Nocardioides sp.]|uniref:PucR family transcriptional regulator n=1 Tax=Nocardioides sp. TaxID=35761 RepID=UPI0027365970|nr:helix-turn-helix domain-containing protein [Nocardioides sp.]MDP3893855.1 helix-turn-helix domain-containing protein [Nocardioides sp.]
MPGPTRQRPRPPLRDRLAAHLPGLLGLTVQQVTSRVEYYSHLCDDIIQGEVSEVARLNLSMFGRLLRGDRDPDGEEMVQILRSVAHRAEEQIPLPEVLAAYHAGFQGCWEHLGELAEPDEAAEVAEIGQLVLACLQSITTAVTETYVETVTALHGREQEARDSLLTSVLAAGDHDQDWHELGLSPWRERTVLVLRHPAPPYEKGAAEAVESRRRGRLVRTALTELTGTTVLDDLGPTGGVVLMRGHVDKAELAARLGTVLRGRWYAGLASADTATDTPVCLEAAKDAALVAQRLRYPRGVYLVPDLVLEIQVTRPGPARAALLATLAPLEGHADLRETLRVHVDERGRRTESAARLHVHPNTLDYRLRRIRELTGVDPTDRDGGQLLRAALIVHRFLLVNSHNGVART